MTTSRPLLVLFTLLALICTAPAGVLTYIPVPAPGTDTNSGISAENGYTSAVDGGNTTGTARVVNDITLDALVGSGDSVTADNCTLTALTGTLSNGSGATTPVPADGVLATALADMTSNNDAQDNSQQEIVLDPDSLTSGTTYDLRIYIRSSSGTGRDVNLAFVGDGQPAAETGFFNEDDATTSPGGFTDAGQVYYVNYRFTWDGDSTPGVTITQKSGQAPFVLYALTNQVVPGTDASETAAAGGGDQGLSMGAVSAASDQVGVTSDTFYQDETLNKNGRWVNVGSYGTAWQPTNVDKDWRPYNNGSWKYADDCGWTWVTDEEWGASTYHYGRWTRTEDLGWCWVPGTVWAGSWVSWRRGNTPQCECVGWAPLPPEAPCDVDVGVSSWVDSTCDIGPDAYSFINVVDFGASSYSSCGCMLDRNSYVNIYEQTENCTNISYTNNTYVNVYAGGPDYNWCNTRVTQNGGRELGKIYVNRVDPGEIKGGKRSQLQGNTLTLAAPKVQKTGHPVHPPKIAATAPASKVDHGWGRIKDPAQKQQLKQKLANQNKGKTPVTAKAKLPPEVAQKVAAKGAGQPGQPGQLKGAGKHPGQSASAGKTAGQSTAPAGKGAGQPTGAGGKIAGQPAGQGQPAKGGKGKRPANAAAAAAKTSGQAVAGGPTAGAAAGGKAAGKGLTPGGPGKGKNAGATQPGTTGQGAVAGTGAAKRRPGESLKHPKGAVAGQQPGGAAPAASGQTAGANATAGAGAGAPGKHPGKGKGQQQPPAASQPPEQATSAPTEQGTGAGGAGGVAAAGPKTKGKQQGAPSAIASGPTEPGAPQPGGPAAKGKGKGKKQTAGGQGATGPGPQAQGAPAQGGPQAGAAPSGSQSGAPATMPQQGSQPGAGSATAGAGAAGAGPKHGGPKGGRNKQKQAGQPVNAPQQPTGPPAAQPGTEQSAGQAAQQQQAQAAQQQKHAQAQAQQQKQAQAQQQAQARQQQQAQAAQQQKQAQAAQQQQAAQARQQQQAQAAQQQKQAQAQQQAQARQQQQAQAAQQQKQAQAQQQAQARQQQQAQAAQQQQAAQARQQQMQQQQQAAQQARQQQMLQQQQAAQAAAAARRRPTPTPTPGH